MIFFAKLNKVCYILSCIFRDQIGDFVFLVLYFLSLLTFAIVARYFMSPWNGWRWTGPHTFDYPPSPVTISSLATRHLKSNIFQIYKAKMLSPPKQSQNFCSRFSHRSRLKRSVPLRTKVNVAVFQSDRGDNGHDDIPAAHHVKEQWKYDKIKNKTDYF